MHVAELSLYSDRRERCTLNRSGNVSSHPFSLAGDPDWPDRPTSSFDIPTRPDPQAQSVSAARANQDDRGRIGLLGQGPSWAISLIKHISRRPYNGAQDHIFLGLIPLHRPCMSGMVPLDINHTGHAPLSQPALSSTAVSKDWTENEHQEADHETLSGPDQYRLAVRKLPLTRRDNRHTFAHKSQPPCPQFHSTTRGTWLSNEQEVHVAVLRMSALSIQVRGPPHRR